MATANGSEVWRPLAATLADDDALATYARLILCSSVSDALKVFTRDFVTLRRHLVDFGLLGRIRSGTSYALVVE